MTSSEPHLRHPNCTCPDSDEEIDQTTMAIMSAMTQFAADAQAMTSVCSRQLATAMVATALSVFHNTTGGLDPEEELDLAVTKVKELRRASLQEQKEQEDARH